jgi:hypothetical protein
VIRRWSRHSRRTSTDPALGNGVGVRGLDRCADDLRTDRAPEVIEGPGELAVAVADQEPEAGLLIKRAKEIPGLLGDPGAGGVGGDTSEVDSSGVQLDEEQHIQPLQEHGVHGEEVTGHDAGCLPAQERPPRGGGRSRRRLETVRAQDSGDGACRNLVAKVRRGCEAIPDTTAGAKEAIAAHTRSRHGRA